MAIELVFVAVGWGGILELRIICGGGGGGGVMSVTFEPFVKDVWGEVILTDPTIDKLTNTNDAY